MHTPLKSEKAAIASPTLKPELTEQKPYRKSQNRYQQSGSTSSSSNTTSNLNRPNSASSKNNWNAKQSRRTLNDGNNNRNQKLEEKPHRISKWKPQKSQESLHSPIHSQGPSISPAPSCSSTNYNLSPNSVKSDDYRSSKSKYSSEFLNMVRQKMEHLNGPPQSQGQSQKGGKHQPQHYMQYEGGDIDLAALRIALSGIGGDNFAPNYNYGFCNSRSHVQLIHAQHQHQQYSGSSWQPVQRNNYPVHYVEHPGSNGNNNGGKNYQYYNRNSYYNSQYLRDDQKTCQCTFQNRNPSTAIYCAHCRYPLKRTNQRRNNRNYHQNQGYAQKSNRGHHNQNKNPGNLVYLNNEELPKSLSPTPTPSNSSKSESPTIENPQNIKKDADQIQITFGDFENLDDEVSSNASSQNNHPIGIKVESEELTMSTSGSSTTSTGNHQEIESYPRTALNNQLTTTQHQDYLGDHHTVWLGGFHPATFPPSPSIEFIQTFPTIHHYQHQQQSYEEPTTQSTSKRRINGRVSPNAGVYQNPVPIQYSATFPPNYVRSNSGNYRSYINYNLAYPSPADRFLARSYMVEIKEPPKQLLNNSKWDRLSQAIWNKFQKRQQTEETYKRKMQLWKQLYLIMKDKFLEKSHPNNGLYLVGSTISGFGADSSDMDMCLVARNCLGADQRSESLNKLGEIRNFIMNSSNIFKEFTLIQARVPILRFKDSHNSLEVDLNVNNCVGVRNTHLLYCYSQMDWRLRPLAQIVKAWAQHNNINDARNMTISSYSLVLMVIHFLQCAVSPPILPCLHKIYPDKFQIYHDICNINMVEELEPIQSENKQTLGELFVEFLKYFSHFEYSKYAISIRTGFVLPVEDCRAVRNMKNDANHWKTLSIEEPFDLTNTARSVYDEEIFERIKQVFYTSWCCMRETLDLNSVFDEPLFKPQPVSSLLYPPVPTSPIQLHQKFYSEPVMVAGDSKLS